MSSPKKHRHDLVADELVDVAVVPAHDVGLALEGEVQHLDHDLGIALLGKGGVAADVAEQHGGEALLTAECDALVVGDLDRRQGPARHEFFQVEALGEPDDHVVHAPSQIADLVLGAHVLDAGAEIALGDLAGDPVDLQDRAADPEREDDRTADRDHEAAQHPEAEALDHHVDRGIRVGLALADQHGPVERARERISREDALARLAIGIRLDADQARARVENVDRHGLDVELIEVGAARFEDLIALRVHERNEAALLGERVLVDEGAQTVQVDARRQHGVLAGEQRAQRQHHGREPIVGFRDVGDVLGVDLAAA